MKNLNLSWRALIAILLSAFALNGCVTSAFYAGQERFQATQAAEKAVEATAIASKASSAENVSLQTTVEVDVSFTLTTGLVEGRMAFIGVGGELDGVANPRLQVDVGDMVEIVLVNGDNIQHNLNVPDFEAKSEDVINQDQQTSLVFEAGQEGVYPYFCDIPGHRQAGMEGELIVGQPAEDQVDALDSVSRPPDDLLSPIRRTASDHVQVNLETREIQARLADGTSYTFWTFNGKVPGPFIRVRVGDVVEVHLKNSPDSTMAHSIDLHAVNGPGGGSVATQTQPGEETSFTFKTLKPGIFVYHCATPSVAQHIANGMYGLILVEPEGGLPPVDREFYVMQGEVYTAEAMGQKGVTTFSQEKMLDESPEYFTFNGSVGGLTTEYPLQAEVGETVRIFFGVGGPNFTSSFHVIGEIFDRVYNLGSLTEEPLTAVQTTIVPTGGAVMVEFTVDVPGRYILVDHSLSRLERGLAGYLVVEGPDAPEIFDGGSGTE